MIRRIVSAAALTSCLLAPFAAQASIFGRSASDNTATNSASKGKSVTLTLKNKSASPMTVYLNDQPIVLAANGGEQKVKAAEGADIFDADRTTVRLHVTSELGGNTISFR